jgi:hypothetical protein
MMASQRQYTEEELQFGDEKVKEMLDSGIIKEISTEPIQWPPASPCP